MPRRLMPNSKERRARRAPPFTMLPFSLRNFFPPRGTSKSRLFPSVTEMVSGIDLVQAQIRIAQGCRLHDAPLSLPKQESVPLYGAALQCRVTTEDPEKNFAPDYGKISTYRSPAGFGIRLDGGTAYASALLAAYYDSLLVKVTAWGLNLP